MDKDEALRLLRAGAAGVAEWNRRRLLEPIPSLRNAYLERTAREDTRLIGADLSDMELTGSVLSGTDLAHANLDGADLRYALMAEGGIEEERLSGSGLITRHASLIDASLRKADLSFAHLGGVFMHRACLAGAQLRGATIRECDVQDADFSHAKMRDTIICSDLSRGQGIDSIVHNGPSYVSAYTIACFGGKPPLNFLQGCGLAPWEILAAQLHGVDLSHSQVTDIGYKLINLRTAGALSISGAFISYAQADATEFAIKLYGRLHDSHLPVWLDKHDMVAGDMGAQIDRALRIHDVVILVLSEEALKSDWVEYELRRARDKERAEDRDVLCPVAIDRTWMDTDKTRKIDPSLWNQLMKKFVVDFSATDFDASYDRLWRGLQTHYERSKTELL